jgi:hypothetical protein
MNINYDVVVVKSFEHVSRILVSKFMTAASIVTDIGLNVGLKKILKSCNPTNDPFTFEELKRQIKNTTVYDDDIKKYPSYLKNQLYEISSFLESYRPNDDVEPTSIEPNLDFIRDLLKSTKNIIRQIHHDSPENKDKETVNCMVDSINLILGVLYVYYTYLLRYEKSIIVSKTIKLALEKTIETYELERLDESFRF